VLDKGQSLPVDFFANERFITRPELEKMRFEEEVSLCFYDALLEELDSGSAVLYDDETTEFRVISKDRPMFVM
jgi:hypothetical protein